MSSENAVAEVLQSLVLLHNVDSPLELPFSSAQISELRKKLEGVQVTRDHILDVEFTFPEKSSPVKVGFKVIDSFPHLIGEFTAKTSISIIEGAENPVGNGDLFNHSRRNEGAGICVRSSEKNETPYLPLSLLASLQIPVISPLIQSTSRVVAEITGNVVDKKTPTMIISCIPCDYLQGLDGILVMSTFTLRSQGLISTQPVLLGTRRAFILHSQHSILKKDSEELSNLLVVARSETRSGLSALISPTSFHNLTRENVLSGSEPKEISIAMHVLSRHDTDSSPSSVTLHPVDKADIYRTGQELYVSESINSYIENQKPFLTWHDGDMIACAIQPNGFNSFWELETTCVKDILPHSSTQYGSRYNYFRVEGSGTGSASVVLGSSHCVKGIANHSGTFATLGPLPSVPVSNEIKYLPCFEETKSKVCQMFFSRQLVRQEQTCGDRALQSYAFLALGSEENLLSQQMCCAVQSAGYNPISIHFALLGNAELLSSLKRLGGQDFSCCFILHNIVLDDDTVKLQTLAETLHEISTLTPIIVCVEDLECPNTFRYLFPIVHIVSNPSEQERRSYLPHLLRRRVLSRAIDMEVVASATNAMSYRDLTAVAATIPHDTVISEKLLLDAIHQHASRIGVRQTSTQIERTHWDDIGGLREAKEKILEKVYLPLRHPQLRKVAQHSGMILYGPPGCGKTLLAKAVATECRMNFLNVKGSELLNMYVGESEKNVRKTFADARACSPCVLFFDELDALAPRRGAKGDSGGVMDRIVSQLLAELDGALSGEHDAFVFVLGATNRPDLLDKSLLRPGRFDQSCYLGPPRKRDDIKSVLESLTRKCKLDSDVDLDALIDRMPRLGAYTGADYYNLVSDALLEALDDTGEIIINQSHLVGALKALSPSLSEEDMEKYTSLEQK